MKYQWTETNIASLAGKRAIVTGTGGLGFEIARMLCGAGCCVILAGRNRAKGEASLAQIRKVDANADIRFEVLDLADLASVADFAARMIAEGSVLDMLINNAGVMAPSKRLVTTDGFELQMGTNYLGHFALTAQLLPLLTAANSPRVVNVSSIAHRSASIQFDDLQSERSYKVWPSYGQSKLAMLMFGLELQCRSDAAGWGIASSPAHPGVARTELVANGPGEKSFLGRLMKLFNPLITHSPAAGALPIVFAAVSPDAVGGGYYGPGGIGEMTGAAANAKISKAGQDRDVAARLWDVSLELTGVSFG